MKLPQKSYKNLILLFVAFALFIIIYNWIDYLVRNKYITECFGNMPVGGSNMTHTVSLPLTTTYSCKNMCGPTGRCSITGEQCMADIDCVGCQPYSPPLSKENGSISGENDAGKLTFGMTPQYSSLTAGYGTKEKIITDNVFSKPPQANFGVDTWSSSSDQVLDLYDTRYKPPSTMMYMPGYSSRYSLTGDFIDEGPIASNDYFM